MRWECVSYCGILGKRKRVYLTLKFYHYEKNSINYFCFCNSISFLQF